MIIKVLSLIGAYGPDFDNNAILVSDVRGDGLAPLYARPSAVTWWRH